jgi:hypothetical protein
MEREGRREGGREGKRVRLVVVVRGGRVVEEEQERKLS